MEYEMLKIVPKLKSELRQRGNRFWFNIVTDNDLKFVCFNKRLYDGIDPGKEIKVRVAYGKASVITEVIGFNPIYPTLGIIPPRNKTERQLLDLMQDNGWELTKKGWPDFACFKDGKLILIEVKPKRSHKLKYWQRRIMLELIKHDVKCYRWSPDGGFEPVLENIKFPIDLP